VHLGWVAGAGVIGFIGNEVVALYRIRVGNRIGSAALRADECTLAQTVTSLAVVVGAAGAAPGFPAADPIIGLVIAVAIGFVVVLAARDVFGRLLDRVDPALDADAELDVDPDLSPAAAHSVTHDAEHELVRAIPKLGSVIVHAYPSHTVRVG
jgi:divalent metal cation (Fe/Co/Zn/Cd) transporter